MTSRAAGPCRWCRPAPSPARGRPGPGQHQDDHPGTGREGLVMRGARARACRVLIIPASSVSFLRCLIMHHGRSGHFLAERAGFHGRPRGLAPTGDMLGLRPARRLLRVRARFAATGSSLAQPPPPERQHPHAHVGHHPRQCRDGKCTPFTTRSRRRSSRALRPAPPRAANSSPASAVNAAAAAACPDGSELVAGVRHLPHRDETTRLESGNG